VTRFLAGLLIGAFLRSLWQRAEERYDVQRGQRAWQAIYEAKGWPEPDTSAHPAFEEWLRSQMKPS
jgi:hypothetical protein